MTVADLIEVIEFDDREIFIKPQGRRMYFDGTVAQVPECLKYCTVQSVTPQIYANYTATDAFKFIPDSNHLFRSGWGVWINNIPELDELVDRVPDFVKDFSGKEYDELYHGFVAALREEKEQQKTEVQPRGNLDFPGELTPISDELLIADGEEDVR